MIQLCTEGALGLVEHGYQEATRCLHFRVDCGGQAPEACRIIESYNDFDGEPVAGALEAIAEQFGDVIETIEVGREYSPVIYIRLDHEADFVRKHGGLGVVQNEIKGILRAVAAQECAWGDHRGLTCRAWWD